MQLEVRLLDARSVEAQAEARAHTFLDKLERDHPGLEIADAGFGAELKAALQQRADRLVELEVASRDDDGALSFADGWRTTLRRMEIRQTFDALESDWEKPLLVAKPGVPFAGVFVDRVQIDGSDYAVVEGRHQITLAPWRPALEAARLQEITGTVQDGATQFEFGNHIQKQLFQDRGQFLAKNLGLDLGLEL